MGIQLRYELHGEESLKNFELGGHIYEIVGESLNRDLIHGSSFHIQKQYIARDGDGKLHEVYVYYYSKIENGRRFAVIDAMRPSEDR